MGGARISAHAHWVYSADALKSSRKLLHVALRGKAGWQQLQQSKENARLSLDKKLIIIDQLSKGSSQRQVSALHEVPKSTVADIWKARDKIKEHLLISDNPSVLKKRCIVKDAQYEELRPATSGLCSNVLEVHQYQAHSYRRKHFSCSQVFILRRIQHHILIIDPL